MGMPIGIGGFLVLLVLSWATGTDFLSLLGGSATVDSPATGRPAATSPREEQMVDFVDAVANDVQSVWAGVLGSRYEPTRVVLFRDAAESACGFAQSATGPFCCPGDHRVYLDLGFFSELDQRPGSHS